MKRSTPRLVLIPLLTTIAFLAWSAIVCAGSNPDTRKDDRNQRKTVKPARRIEVIVKVPAFTPPKAAVYLTGDQEGLCEWEPDCIQLKAIAPLTYRGEIHVPSDLEVLQYKITRGSWENEASTWQSKPLANQVLEIGPKTHRVVVDVVNWIDLPALGVSGHVEIYDDVYSPQLDNFRRISVWLPQGYGKSKVRYPVLYMHDGQNVFDPHTSFHNVDWGVDEAMARLKKQAGLEAIVVAVDCMPKERFEEYDYTIRGHRYLKFLIDNVKPMIDARYRTRPERESTFIMGSSMGALISMAAVWRHADVFSAAGAVSLPVFIQDFALYRIIDKREPAMPIRIYMDHGNHGRDGGYESHAVEFVRYLQRRGFNEMNLQYRVFEYDDHTEADWSRRVELPLRFLFEI